MSRSLDPRLLRAAPAVRRLVVALGAVQTAEALLTVAQAALLARLLASVVLGEALDGRLLLWFAAAVAVRQGAAAARGRLAAGASGQARAQLRRAVLAAVTRLGPVWATAQPAGRLVTASGPGLEALDGLVAQAVPALVGAAVVPAVVLVAIGLADWQSAALLLATLPLVPLFMVLVGVTTRRRTAAQYDALARLGGHFLDLVQGLTTLKVYGQAHRQVETVRRATDTYRRQAMAALRVAFLSGLVLDLLATLSVAVVAVDVGLRLDHDRLGLQTALLVLLLAPELYAPLRALGAQHHAAEQGRAAAAAALDVLDDAIAVGDHPTPSDGDGSIELTGVTVRYPGREVPALDRLDLDVPAGQVLVVQGRSGGGKSTLLAVLLGFVAPTPGRAAAAAPAATAWVPQRTRLTRATVHEEASLGDVGGPAHLVDAALADCHAPPPDTVLGEDGMSLSAGERRRVVLAKALVRARAVHGRGGRPLVLLDEPGEDLDVATEQVVASVVSSLAGWATVVLVTHSPRLARLADRRIELSDGRLVSDRPQVPAHALRVLPRTWPGGDARPALPEVDAPAGLTLRALRRYAADAGAGRLLVAAAALSGAAGLAGLLLTASSLWLICRAAAHPEVQALALAVVAVRTAALARALLRYGERLTGHDGALRLLASVRAEVFAALEPLAPAGLTTLRRGDLLRRFVSDVDGVQEAWVRAVVPLAGAAVTAAGAVTLAAALDPRAGAVTAGGLLTGLLAAALTRRLAGDSGTLAAAAGLRDTRGSALLDGLAELTAYGVAPAAVAEVAAADRVVLRAGRRPAAAAALGAVLTGLVGAATLAGVLAVMAPAVARGALSPAGAAAVLACALVGLDALTLLPAAVTGWSVAAAGLGRVGALLAMPVPVPEPTLVRSPPAGRIALQADDVTLRPAPGAPAVLVGACLEVRPGERVALVGPSGSGKSTLLAAALRLVPLQAGRLLLTAGEEQVPLVDVPAAEVPPRVSGSLQGDHVFAASLRDNLRVVRPDADDRDLDVVAGRAGLTGLLASLPLGWSTPAGPDGAALSGGQRQRLLLARALLADPDVLVLDEPTAHLDDATADAVLRDLLLVTRNTTMLLSTHRALPDGRFDRVLAVSAGSLSTQHAATDLVLRAGGTASATR